MAVFYGKKSQYEIRMRNISKVAFLIWFGYSVYILSFTIFKFIHFNFSLGSLIALLIVFGPIYFIVDYLRRKQQSTYFKFASGLRGEAATWYELHRLDNTYHVFEDIKLPGHDENIDFVVVGPTGIYAIEVKNHHGKVEFNGNDLTINNKLFEKDFLSQSMREATSIHDYLVKNGVTNAFVIPILVFSHRFAIVRFGIMPVKNVRVIQYRWLVKMITSEPRSYPDQRTVDLLKTTYA